MSVSIRSRFLPVLIAVLSAALVPTEAARAATFTVTTTADSGAGSLRAAITSANATTTPDLIQFNIPGTGPFTLTPASALPTISQPLTIDGYSQPGAAANTLDEGDNAVILIRIDGAAAGSTTSGLAACARVTVKGLSITGFLQHGVVIGADASGSLCPGVPSGSSVNGNFIGLRPDGVTAAGNRFDGVLLFAASAIVGGSTPAERNVVSSNGTVGGSATSSFGIQVNEVSASGTVIQGNYIGTDASGTLDRGNRGEGVHLGISATGVSVGGAVLNRIAFNATGIGMVGSATGNLIAGNEIFGNDGAAPGGVGIDLYAGTTADGHTANDVNDGDSGGNNLQNHPAGIAATRIASGLHLTGTVDRPTLPAVQSFTIAVYVSSACDPSGFGEGEHFLGSFAVVSSSSSAQTFSADLAVTRELPIGSVITMTATDQSNNTSEFSACATLDGNAPLVVTSTADTDGTTCGATCTLRQAINVANATAGADTIRFNLPGTGERTITLGSNLPNITETLEIDGYSQPGSAPNTLPDASNAVLLVRLTGAGASHLLTTCAPNTVIEGLSLTGAGVGIGIGLNGAVLCAASGAADFSVVRGCFVGLTTAGAAGANSFGIRVGQSRVRIGGPALADRNVISSNLTGIELAATPADGSVVEGNLVGLDPTGTAVRRNTVVGMAFRGGASNIRVGSDTAPNRIANNQLGVLVSSTGQNVDLARNDYAANLGLAIDLCALPSGCADGITPNDADDADSGANGLQNFPVLSGASQVGTALTVAGSLDVPPGSPSAPYLIALYASASCDALGNGEGENYLGTFSRSLTGTSQNFSITLDSANLIGSAITATATFQGSTSEFSACTTVVDGDLVFSNGFE